ncbi:MAG: DUF3592 domain-containing protein [Terracidiphilus sp.]
MLWNRLDEVRKVVGELDQPLPRPVRLSGVGISRLVVALACIVFGVGMAASACRDELRRQAENESVVRRLTTEGRETQATATHLYTGMGGYVVNYGYTVDGRTFQRGAFIAEEQWRSLEVGSPLAIRYLPSNPHEAYPDSAPPNSQNYSSIALPMAGMILFLTWSFATICLWDVVSQRRLLARGGAALGIVTRCKAGARDRISGYYLNYDFSVPGDAPYQGRDFSGPQQAEGSPVTVVYDPNNPRRSALYPMGTVRLAALAPVGSDSITGR